MPGNQESFFQFREQLSKVLREVKHIGKPVCAAMGLLLLSAALTYIVVSGISGEMRPLPPLAKTLQLPQPLQSSSATQQVPAVTVEPKVAQEGPAFSVVASKGETSFAQPSRLPEGTITAAFGWQQHPVFQDWRFHTGIDIAMPAGQSVLALSGGRVSEVTKDRQLGITVVVENGDYIFYYASLAAATAKTGTVVEAGAIIGTVGQSNTEPYDHLHLAVKKQGNYIDPQSLMN